ARCLQRLPRFNHLTPAVVGHGQYWIDQGPVRSDRLSCQRCPQPADCLLVLSGTEFGNPQDVLRKPGPGMLVDSALCQIQERLRIRLRIAAESTGSHDLEGEMDAARSAESLTHPI